MISHEPTIFIRASWHLPLRWQGRRFLNGLSNHYFLWVFIKVFNPSHMLISFFGPTESWPQALLLHQCSSSQGPEHCRELFVLKLRNRFFFCVKRPSEWILTHKQVVETSLSWKVFLEVFTIKPTHSRHS